MKDKFCIELQNFSINKCKMITWKGEMTKIRLKRGEKGDIYLTNVYRHLQSVESSE